MNFLDMVLNFLASSFIYFSSFCLAPFLKHHLVLWTGVDEPNPRLRVDFGAVAARGEKAEALKEAGKEKKELMLCQGLSRAISFSNEEGDAMLILDKLSILNKPVGIKLFRFMPVVGVIVDPPDIGVDRCALSDDMALDLHILSGRVGCGVHEAGDCGGRCLEFDYP